MAACSINASRVGSPPASLTKGSYSGRAQSCPAAGRYAFPASAIVLSLFLTQHCIGVLATARRGGEGRGAAFNAERAEAAESSWSSLETSPRAWRARRFRRLGGLSSIHLRPTPHRPGRPPPERALRTRGSCALAL